MFTIENVKNLFWCDSEHSFFECTVKYKEFEEEMPVGVNAVDSYPHIKELWEKGNSGAYGVISEYVAPPAAELQEQPEVQGAQTL